ncbi:hypothetical protein NDU88_009980 [Pleurodeles waltl]|uniref:Uncharacterized protein n=1 Tax=Pleurodeles waltl TaxID=8319 RepID=A0AAV7QZ28_PLEWA|nr:hypothetical protein NDU88_009980 [Pleurodeles waltl]
MSRSWRCPPSFLRSLGPFNSSDFNRSPFCFRRYSRRWADSGLPLATSVQSLIMGSFSLPARQAAAPLASTGLHFAFAVFCAAGPIPIHCSLATSIRLRIMGSSSYRPGGPSWYLAGCRRRQSEAGNGHTRRIPGPGVLRSRLLWPRHQQPGSLRPQLGPVTGGTPRPIQVPSGSCSRQCASLLVVLWCAGVHSATDSTWFET